MINVRHGVFETNSSSVHTLVLCTEDQYKQMERGEILLDYRGNQYTVKEATDCMVESIKKNPQWYEDYQVEFIKDIENKSQYQIIEWLQKSEEYYTLDDWLNHEYYETYKDEIVTPGGEKVIAFGYYGQDY